MSDKLPYPIGIEYTVNPVSKYIDKNIILNEIKYHSSFATWIKDACEIDDQCL